MQNLDTIIKLVDNYWKFNDQVPMSTWHDKQDLLNELEKLKEEKITQLSGLSDYELSLDQLVYKIKGTESSLECIGILRNFISDVFCNA